MDATEGGRAGAGFRVGVLVGGLLVALAASGCGDSSERPVAQVTDSAGVRIVSSPGTAPDHALVLEEAEVAIGVLDGPPEQQFDRIASARFGADGTIVVADFGLAEIRVFQPDGTLVRSMGGPGEGPGEFRFLAGAWPVEGGYVAYDAQLRRATRFDVGGKLVATATLTVPEETAFPESGGMAGPDALLTRATTFDFAAPDGEEVRNPVVVLLHRLDGSVLDTVGVVLGPGTLVRRSGTGGDLSVNVFRIPFSPQPEVAGSATRVALTTGEAFEIRVHEVGGSLTDVFRLLEAPPARTEAHLEAWATESIRGEVTPAAIRERVGQFADVPLPERLPGYSGLLFSSDGSLWARRFSPPGTDAERWDVFAADGTHRGGVSAPSGFEIMEVVDRRVLGVATDPLGVQRVQVLPLSFN